MSKSNIRRIRYALTLAASLALAFVVNAKLLVEGIDYKVTYSNNVNVGTGYVFIEGIGNYKTDAPIVKTFTIYKDFMYYTGSALCPNVVVKYRNHTLVEGTHYTVEYSSNIEVGTANAIVRAVAGSGFSGTKTLVFQIINSDGISQEEIAKQNAKELACEL